MPYKSQHISNRKEHAQRFCFSIWESFSLKYQANVKLGRGVEKLHIICTKLKLEDKLCSELHSYEVKNGAK